MIGEEQKPLLSQMLAFRCTEQERAEVRELMDESGLSPSESAMVRYLLVLGLRAAKAKRRNGHVNMTTTTTIKQKTT